MSKYGSNSYIYYQVKIMFFQEENNIQIIRKLIISPFTVGMMGILGVVKNNDENKTQIMKELLTKADTLFDQGDYRGTYDFLSKYKVNSIL